MSKKNFFREIGELLSLGTQLALIIIIPIIGCVYIGKTLDTKFNTSPLFLLIFILLGIGSAFLSGYKTLQMYMKRK